MCNLIGDCPEWRMAIHADEVRMILCRSDGRKVSPNIKGQKKFCPQTVLLYTEVFEGLTL